MNIIPWWQRRLPAWWRKLGLGLLAVATALIAAIGVASAIVGAHLFGRWAFLGEPLPSGN